MDRPERLDRQAERWNRIMVRVVLAILGAVTLLMLAAMATTPFLLPSLLLIAVASVTGYIAINGTPSRE